MLHLLLEKYNVLAIQQLPKFSANSTVQYENKAKLRHCCNLCIRIYHIYIMQQLEYAVLVLNIFLGQKNIVTAVSCKRS